MNIPYIQVQVSSLTAQGTIINPGTNIMWDTLITKTDDITLDAIRGVIQLTTPGIYHAEWHISAGGAEQTAPFVLAVETSENIMIPGTSMGVPGEISGSAVFKLNAPGTVSLVNRTTPITYGTVGAMANLVIHMLADSTGSNGADGGSGSGGGRLMTIPFSSGQGTTTRPGINEYGMLTQTSIMSAGGLNSTIFNVSMGQFFEVPIGRNAVQYLYSLPFDAKLVGISAIFNNYAAVNLTNPMTHISPFVALATQYIPRTFNFQIQNASRTFPEYGYFGTSANTTILTASKTDFQDIIVPAGTPFAVAAGLISLGFISQNIETYVYMNGSMVFEEV